MSFTLYIIIFVVGSIGNGLVIWIAGFRMKKTISAVWFLHLAIADFLCCATLPLRMAQWLSLDSSLSSSFILCKLSIFLFTINMTASVLFLIAMSIDRWVSVMWPFWARVHRTCRLVRIAAGLIWMFGLVLTGLVFYLYGFYFNDPTEWCVFNGCHAVVYFDNVKHITRYVRLVTMFVIPFLIISISYATIFFKLRASKRPQRSHRSYRIITAVILGFFICWVPYYIWPLTPKYDEGYFQFHTINTIIINLAFFNSCINPIIYVFMGQDFKQDFFRSIPFRLERALGEQPNDPSLDVEDFDHTHATTL
ncbi:C3a anaphylatoxin chemotactic receptor-like [Leptodactylus fuscus]|uniref:C3a anaphylatoxin chemotactic receptor-like n=1 Tax=Leptodactylus fuscus TaxID=238119 RepID=UPI003F4E7FA4